MQSSIIRFFPQCLAATARFHGCGDVFSAETVGVLTPADADEHPLAQLVGGVGEDDGGVEVAAFSKHPEEVGGVEIVEGGGDKSAPNLQKTSYSIKHFTLFAKQTTKKHI